MLLNRPKSSRLLSKGQQKGNENVVTSSTTALGLARKDIQNDTHNMLQFREEVKQIKFRPKR